MRQLLIFVTAMVLFLSIPTAFSQDVSSPFVTTPFQDVNVRSGPGTTYHAVTRLRTGVQVTVVERNSTGTWVRVQQTLQDGTIYIDGWVLSGFFNLSPDLKFSEVPVSNLADAQPENAESLSLRPLYSAPVISSISPTMHDVYERGLEQGHFTQVITKVGDSVSADPLYLTPMSRPGVVLGPYDYLRDALDLFGASTQSDSVAARVGLNTYALFDPTWANSAECQGGETPLGCELRLKKPSIALIMFGANDVMHLNEVEYDQQMHRIVEETLAQGVIPVLSTFSFHFDPSNPLSGKSVVFNGKVIQIATDYQIPLINLWLAARPLPDDGLEQDGIHMNHWGTDILQFDNSFPAYSGASLRNLLALRMLDEIRRTIFLDSTAVG